jgi:hypothetical protein
MKKGATKTAILLYLLSVVLTFGHSFNNIDSTYVDWQSREVRDMSGSTLAVLALFCAVASPLYWSAFYFDKFGK